MAGGPLRAKQALPWALSVVIHGVVALSLLAIPKYRHPPRKQAIELTQRKFPPLPPKRVEPPPPPPKARPRTKVAMRRKLVRKAPRPTPAEQPKPKPQPRSTEPTRAPTFGIKMSGTASAAPGTGIQVPEGDTLLTKPTRKPQKKKKPGKIAKQDRPGFKTKFKQGERAPVAVVTTMPKINKRVIPEYPERMKDLGIEGRVVLELSIDGEGRVTKARVVKGLHPMLDEAARKAALKMRFTPAQVNGTSVAIKIPYTFTFVLD